MSTVTFAAGVVADDSLPEDGKHLLTVGTQGVKHLISMRNDFSFRPPLRNNKKIRDLSGYPGDELEPVAGHADASLKITGDGKVMWVSNTRGIRFNQAAAGNHILLPVDIVAEILADNSPQSWGAYLWTTVPTLATFPANSTVRAILSWATGANGFVAGPEFFLVGWRTSGTTKQGVVHFPFGSVINSGGVRTFDILDEDCGKPILIHPFRDGSVSPSPIGIRAKNQRAVMDAGAANVIANTVAGRTALTGRFGVGTAFPSNDIDFTVFELGIENYAESGRFVDHYAILDELFQDAVDAGDFGLIPT